MKNQSVFKNYYIMMSEESGQMMRIIYLRKKLLYFCKVRSIRGNFTENKATCCKNMIWDNIWAWWLLKVTAKLMKTKFIHWHWLCFSFFIFQIKIYTKFVFSKITINTIWCVNKYIHFLRVVEIIKIGFWIVGGGDFWCAVVLLLNIDITVL